MKRCPTCDRVESDDALAFCRSDGTPLVRESGAVTGSAKFSSVKDADTTETRILSTGEALNRPTGPTTELNGRQASGNTRELKKPKSRRALIVSSASIIAVAVAASTYLYLSHVKTDTARNSIAVLPFQNARNDPDAEYLSDGLAESLINSLSRLPNVKVIALTSVLRYKGQQIDPQGVGRDLGVGAVLTGRVVQRGDSLVINAELVDAQDRSHLWGERYDRQLAELATVQNEIARDVSNKLRVKLSGMDEHRLAEGHTANPEAYQLYLQGQFHWNKRSPEGVRTAAEYFKQAVAVDPNYALAYTGLANAYSILPIYDSTAKPKETMPLAREAALKALELDADLAEAHASLGVILDTYDWNPAEAVKHYRRAIELNPNFAAAHRWLGERLVADGQFEEGLAELRRSLELDPFALASNRAFGGMLNYARRYDEAIIQLQKTLELDPNFKRANYNLYESYANKGMYSEAVATYLRGISSEGESTHGAGAKEAFSKNGWQGFLRHEEAYLEKQPQAFPQDIAKLYARLGDKDKAFAWLEKAYEARSEGLTWLKVDPAYDPLRSDPRFTDLVRRVGLPQE